MIRIEGLRMTTGCATSTSLAPSLIVAALLRSADADAVEAPAAFRTEAVAALTDDDVVATRAVADARRVVALTTGVVASVTTCRSGGGCSSGSRKTSAGNSASGFRSQGAGVWPIDRCGTSSSVIG